MRFDNIIEAIGRTPIIKLNKLSNPDSAVIYVKMESFNPCHSVKDRVGAAMIETAEKDGSLKPGMTIVEPTSGNTGIGLAMTAAAKGYKIVIIMPDTMSIERRKILKLLGAEIILTPGEDGMKGAVSKANELMREKGYYQPHQFSNPANPEIHRQTTAKEIIDDLDDIHLDAFIMGVGTGGTLSGAGEVLKKRYGCRVYAVEPDDSPILSGGKPGPHQIQGIGAGFIPENYTAEVVDEIIRVKSKDAFEMAKQLARRDGILAGISSGANVKAAIQVASGLDRGKTVVTLIADSGERYLSTFLTDD
ncbi:MAG: cysteine synthase A [candidate division Zixibacteria bacterium]|nr:cysteine synthase A [candidate division Zixibacteria bacterium]